MDDTTDIGPAGQPGSIIPGNIGPGMMPPAPGPADETPLGDRLGRDPSNLGDDVRDEGDVVYPDPEPSDNNL